MNSAPDGGPYLVAALFCERILTETDAVQSAIRIVDRLAIAAVGKNVPDEMPLVPTNLWYMVSLRSGRARGRHTLRLEIEKPDTLRTEMHQQDILFEGEERGATIVLEVRGGFPQEGLYWVHVFVNDRQLTQTPLRIMYQRTAKPASQ